VPILSYSKCGVPRYLKIGNAEVGNVKQFVTEAVRFEIEKLVKSIRAEQNMTTIPPLSKFPLLIVYAQNNQKAKVLTPDQIENKPFSQIITAMTSDHSKK
jgi:hypothetical protein